ncbi:catalase family protein [Kovacikia minuta CCNUW1]|uniref:catalase family protein n=1 Tax=Kovacikia minuta TaxID=2931930 RepID=UPI001CCC8911|nr:catalase family protein [Kovacikia minuta]UBF26686.1 catalase family protein [Kovacikia minuta CCNUW1]
MRLAFCKWLALVSLVLFIGFTQFANPAVAATSDSATGLIDDAAQVITETVAKSAEPGLRGQHPKGHGDVWAEFTVESNLPEDLKVGVFQQPGKTFPAWIRFSNAREKDDTKKGAHGMAIKLMGVEGEKILPDEKDEKTQDFILLDHPVFFLRNAQDSAVFFNALAQSSGQPPLKQFFFASVNPLKWHTREFQTLLAMRKKITSPLNTQYWSTTPYQLGSTAIKFSAKPTGAQTAPAISKTENYLHTALVEQLKTQDASFDFLIQRQTDPVKMPIDDATVEWSEKESPLQKVATIRIPRQVFDSREQAKFGENLSFTPWHSLPEHAPLGSINAARKIIYQTLSEKRHQEQNTAVQEPTVQSFTPDLVSADDRAS